MSQQIMSRQLSLLRARAEFYDLATATEQYFQYALRHDLKLDRLVDFAGATGIIDVAECGVRRFDWAVREGAFPAFVCEALGRDGVTVLDLVAWPLGDPNRVLSMFGTAAWLGAWSVWNPTTYYLGKPLMVHRNPLEWLQAGCLGAAVITPSLAARELIDLPGPVSARDREHAQSLASLLSSLTRRPQILVPRHKVT